MRSSEMQHPITSRCLTINPSFDAECIGPKAMIIYNEEQYVVLEGADVALILSYLRDRVCWTKDLVGQLEGAIPAERVCAILAQLEARGWVVEYDPEATREEAAFWALMDLDTRLISRRLRQVQVDIQSFGRLDNAGLRSALKSLHIRVDDNGEE